MILRDKYLQQLILNRNNGFAKIIITEFRDKAVTIQAYRLSFDKLYGYTEGSKIEAIYEYMQYGGMPLASLKGEEKYLIGLFETTHFKDVVERNQLKKSESLDELCNIVNEGAGSLLNTEKIDKITIGKYWILC